MAVGLVVVQAIRQPDDAVNCQVIAQNGFDLLTVQVRVAVVVEQAFLGGDQGAFTIDMDRAAFQHEAFGVVALAAFHLQHLAGHLLVAVPWRVQTTLEAAPGIEAPVDTTHFTAVVDDEGRAGITNPGVVVADFHHTNVRQVQTGAGVIVLSGGDGNGHRLETGDSLGQGHVGSLHRLATQAPVVRALGPDHPDLGLWRPFGRHVEAVGARGTGKRFHR
ncbi:hypothetical protein D3C80_1339120 [compost metagenome]